MIFHGNILQKYSKRLRMVNLMCILCLKPGNATVNGKGVVKSTVGWNSDALMKKWQSWNFISSLQLQNYRFLYLSKVYQLIYASCFSLAISIACSSDYNE